MQSYSQIMEGGLADLDWMDLWTISQPLSLTPKMQSRTPSDNNPGLYVSLQVPYPASTLANLFASFQMRAYNYGYNHLFNPGSKQLSLSFELGCVEFDIVFTPAPNQPGDVLV